ncbi:MAG: ankyrin repeat domain-containing protein [Puniceicoccales bacterium]|nr:ankyrin repeat domain-containing protein [Puniceicoccales bacterium]
MGKKISVLFTSVLLGTTAVKGVGSWQFFDNLPEESRQFVLACFTGDRDAIDFFLEAGCDPNLVVDPSTNATLAMCLATVVPTVPEEPRIPMVLEEPRRVSLQILMLHPSFNPNLRNNFGDTVAHMCVKLRLPPIVSILLDLPNFDVNARGQFGATISHLIALQSIHLPGFGPWSEIIEKIFAHLNWDSEAVDNRGRTVKDLLVVKERELSSESTGRDVAAEREVAAWRNVLLGLENVGNLLEGDARTTLRNVLEVFGNAGNLFGGARRSVERDTLLRNIGIWFQKIGEVQARALEPASEREVRDMMMSGCDTDEIKDKIAEHPEINVNWRDRSNGNRTLLMYATATGNVEFVRVILALPDVDLSLVDSEGHNAFFYAEANRNPKMIEILQATEDPSPEIEQ